FSTRTRLFVPRCPGRWAGSAAGSAGSSPTSRTAGSSNVAGTRSASLATGFARQHRVRAQHLQRLNALGERIEGLPYRRIVSPPDQVGEEHVVPEADPPRAGFDLR